VLIIAIDTVVLQPQQLERRVNQLERQNERQEREINQLQRDVAELRAQLQKCCGHDDHDHHDHDDCEEEEKKGFFARLFGK
jgi:predicted RNase H-like nuclease (RuvC/YqgF family)